MGLGLCISDKLTVMLMLMVWGPLFRITLSSAQYQFLPLWTHGGHGRWGYFRIFQIELGKLGYSQLPYS